MPVALLAAFFESRFADPRVVPQKDRRQQDDRRQVWRGGRRVSDFSQLNTVGCIAPTAANGESRKHSIEGIIH